MNLSFSFGFGLRSSLGFGLSFSLGSSLSLGFGLGSSLRSSLGSTWRLIFGLHKQHQSGGGGKLFEISLLWGLHVQGQLTGQVIGEGEGG